MRPCFNKFFDDFLAITLVLLELKGMWHIVELFSITCCQLTYDSDNTL